MAQRGSRTRVCEGAAKDRSVELSRRYHHRAFARQRRMEIRRAAALRSNRQICRDHVHANLRHVEGLYSRPWYLPGCCHAHTTLWRAWCLRIYELVSTLPRRATLRLQIAPNKALQATAG